MNGVFDGSSARLDGSSGSRTHPRAPKCRRGTTVQPFQPWSLYAHRSEPMIDSAEDRTAVEAERAPAHVVRPPPPTTPTPRPRCGPGIQNQALRRDSPTGRSDASATTRRRCRSTSSRRTARPTRSRSSTAASPARPSDTRRTRTARVLPRAVAIERAAVGLQILRQVLRGHRRAGLGRAPLDVIHRSGEQPDARRRHGFDQRVFADFDARCRPGTGSRRARPRCAADRPGTNGMSRTAGSLSPSRSSVATPSTRARYAGGASWA